ncbi:MAG: LiaI-LiaF-like domain-containing protein [Anaerolineae bacterium]
MSNFGEPFEEEQLVTSETALEGEGPIASAAPPPITPEEPLRPSYETHRPRRRRPPSVFWPLVFIGAGVMLLLSNLGYLPWQSWGVLWRLWPLLIIALGVDLLIGRRSVIGAIISGVLILALVGVIVMIALFAQNIPGVSDWIQQPEFQTRRVEYSLTGVERATVYIDWTSVPGYLSALEDSPNLIEGDVDYLGELTFDVSVRGDQANVKLDSRSTGIWFWPFDLGDRTDKRWDVGLSPNVPLDLTLDAGSGPCDFDLAGLQVSGLVLDAGSGPVDLVLPSGSSFEAKIDGGSGPLTIVLPRNVGARVELDSGSGPFSPDARFELMRGRRRGDGTWETGNYDTAEHTITLEIDQGSGPITIR